MTSLYMQFLIINVKNKFKIFLYANYNYPNRCISKGHKLINVDLIRNELILNLVICRKRKPNDASWPKYNKSNIM